MKDKKIPTLDIYPQVDTKQELRLRVMQHFNVEYEWNLAPREVETLSLLYSKAVEMMLKGQKFQDVNTLLFSKEGKNTMVQELKTSYNTYANALTKLRKLEIIQDNILSKKFLFNLPEQLDLRVRYGNRREEDTK